MLSTPISTGGPLSALTLVNGHDGTGRNRPQASHSRATPDFVQIMQEDAEAVAETLSARENPDAPMDLPPDLLTENEGRTAVAAPKEMDRPLTDIITGESTLSPGQGTIVAENVSAVEPLALSQNTDFARSAEHETRAAPGTVGILGKIARAPDQTSSPVPGQTQTNAALHGSASMQPAEATPSRAELLLAAGETAARGTGARAAPNASPEPNSGGTRLMHAAKPVVHAVAPHPVTSAAREGTSGTIGRNNIHHAPSSPIENAASSPSQPATPALLTSYPSRPFTTEATGADFSALNFEGGEPTLRLDLRGTATITPVNGPIPQSVLLRTDLPQHLAMQIASAVQKGRPERPVQLILHPAELGQVRISLSSTDGTVTVTVITERPETLDLMRRNIGTLAQEFQEIGYQQAQFAFGGGHSAPSGEQGPGNRDSGQDQGAMPDQMQERPQPATTAPLISDRLDLRL